MPVVVGVVAMLATRLFPGRDEFREGVAAYLLLLAYFYRVWAGKGLIDTNACEPRLRRVQFLMLCVGVFPLCFLELILLAMSDGPRDEPPLMLADYLVFGLILGLYLACMAVAMYPGRTLPAIPAGGDDQIRAPWAEQR
jgi:hypothetical protein